MKISVCDTLLDWYDPGLRDLPWKTTRDPYLIWLSEIILQQTRVEQGRSYYLRFSEMYPSVADLAEAPIDDVLWLWEGLGYYSRARNLHAAARQVQDEFGGEFPDSYHNLLKLKGVGNYTAAAIASFAYGEPVPVVDGNVIRFLSRLFGVREPVDTTAGRRRIEDLAERAIDRERPAEFNQAIMDFGALVCKPANPLCIECPFRDDCIAHREGLVERLPFKAKKQVRKDRHFTYLFLHDGTDTFIERRGGNDIWKGLYQFPVAEGASGGAGPLIRRLSAAPFWAPWIAAARETVISEDVRQVLSHRNVHAVFVRIRVDDLSEHPVDSHWRRVAIRELGAFAFPRIVRLYIDGLLDV